MTRRLEKQLHMTRKVRLLIYLIEECYMFGETDDVKYLCKFMMRYLSNIPKKERMKLSPLYGWDLGYLSSWRVIEPLLYHMA